MNQIFEFQCTRQELLWVQEIYMLNEWLDTCGGGGGTSNPFNYAWMSAPLHID